MSKRRNVPGSSIPAPIFARRRCAKISATVDAVVFTHSHTDHIMGFDDLRRFSHARGSMPVYASAETMRDLERVFEFAFQSGQSVSMVI